MKVILFVTESTPRNEIEEVINEHRKLFVHDIQIKTLVSLTVHQAGLVMTSALKLPFNPVENIAGKDVLVFYNAILKQVVNYSFVCVILAKDEQKKLVKLLKTSIGNHFIRTLKGITTIKFDSYKKRNIRIMLPNRFKDLTDKINASKNILTLKQGWDDEDAVPIKLETWKKAISFLTEHAMWLYNNHRNFVLESPAINPCPNGTIDLLWENESYQLLVNIFENSGKYYGKYNGKEIKGRIEKHIITNELLTLWLEKVPA